MKMRHSAYEVFLWDSDSRSWTVFLRSSSSSSSKCADLMTSDAHRPMQLSAKYANDRSCGAHGVHDLTAAIENERPADGDLDELPDGGDFADDLSFFDPMRTAAGSESGTLLGSGSGAHTAVAAAASAEALAAA